MIIEMTGKRCGQLKVLGFVGTNKQGLALWHCKCDCGKTKVISGHALRVSKTQSCGCLFRKRFRDLTGTRIKHWTFLERVGTERHQYPTYRMKCDCGKIVTRRAHGIVYMRQTSSCGCCSYENQIKKKIGKRFGRVVIVKYLGRSKKGFRWLCKCDCGKMVEISSRVLGRSYPENISCGNHLPVAIEKKILGKRFGWLVPLKYLGICLHGKDKRPWRKWLCQCDCGKKTVTTTFMLTSGYRRSCGCKLLPGNRACKHGMGRTWQYAKWRGICYTAKRNHIPMHPEWKDSVKAFLEGMTGMPRYASLKMLLPEKGYVPGNCYWKPRKANEKLNPVRNSFATITAEDIKG